MSEAVKELVVQHTPGPWSEKGGDIVAADDTHVVCFGHDYDDYGAICARYLNGEAGPWRPGGYPVHDAEAAANARLIAAAPELLDELDTLCQAIEGHRAGALTADGLWHYVVKARAAIAKAEGSS